MATTIKEQIELELERISCGTLLQTFDDTMEASSLFQDGFLRCTSGKGQIVTNRIYSGVEISFYTLLADSVVLSNKVSGHTLEINYCRYGRAGWEMADGTLYLGPGDYALHSMSSCTDSLLTLPAGYYQGFSLRIDLDTLNRQPPELLQDIKINTELFSHDLSAKNSFISYPKNAKMEPIFSGFYDFPSHLQLSCFRLKFQELLLWLSYSQPQSPAPLNQYQAEQIAIVKQIHEHLTDHLDQRITIDGLAKEYLINPTTLKAVFKTVYGDSLAAHIKEHRMETAAKLLCSTNESISQIAKQVGYENQSKFTAAFKEIYEMLPTEYRKTHYTTGTTCNHVM